MPTLLIKPDEDACATLYDCAVVEMTDELWRRLRRGYSTLGALQADDPTLHSLVFEAGAGEAWFVALPDHLPSGAALVDELGEAFDKSPVVRRQIEASPDDTYRDRIEVSQEGVRWTGIIDATEEEVGTLVVSWEELRAALREVQDG